MRDDETVVLGEKYHTFMVTNKFHEANNPVFDSGATSHVWNHFGYFWLFRQSNGSGISLRLANGIFVQLGLMGLELILWLS